MDAQWTFLTRRLIDAAQTRTHAIGAALFRDLAEGRSFGALHRLVECLAARVLALPAARDLTAIGHSSGWDMLAGFVVGVAGTAALPDCSSMSKLAAGQRPAVGHQRRRRDLHAQRARRGRAGAARRLAAAGRRRSRSRVGAGAARGRRRRRRLHRHAHRPRERARRRTDHRRAAGAGRRRAARARRVAGHGAHAAARRRADRVGADVRADARRDDRRAALRRVGGDAAGGGGDARARRDPLRAVPRFRCGGADVRHHLAVDAAVRRAQCRRTATSPTPT